MSDQAGLIDAQLHISTQAQAHSWMAGCLCLLDPSARQACQASSTALGPKMLHSADTLVALSLIGLLLPPHDQDTSWPWSQGAQASSHQLDLASNSWDLNTADVGLVLGLFIVLLRA